MSGVEESGKQWGLLAQTQPHSKLLIPLGCVSALTQGRTRSRRPLEPARCVNGFLRASRQVEIPGSSG